MLKGVKRNYQKKATRIKGIKEVSERKKMRHEEECDDKYQNKMERE